MTAIDQISKQRLEELAGVRGNVNAAGKAAVRKSDMAAIVSLAALTSEQISGNSVTVDEYNALQADVAVLFAAIQQIAAKVKT